MLKKKKIVKKRREEKKRKKPMGLSVAALSAETITAGPCTSGCSSYHIVPQQTHRMRQEKLLQRLQHLYSAFR